MSFDSCTPVELITDGTPITYGVVQPGPEDADGVLFIRGGDISGGRINTANLRTISRELSHQYKRTLLKGGELVISLVGNPGEVAIVPNALKGANIARQIGLVRVDKNRFHPKFVQYYLMSPAGKAQLFSYSLGSVQSVINLKELKRVEIPNFPLETQEKIVKCLGEIDEKIDLSLRINQTLEAMAQAIFKSWFVDFDPVRAKVAAIEQGQDPLRAAMRAISGKTDAELDQMPREHHDQLAATAALFPDAMQESELGEIPKGWSFHQIAEFGEVVCGKTPAKSNPDYFGSGTPFIKIPDMHNNVYVTQSSEQLTVQGVASQPKKTIPPGSICVSCIATVGKVVLIHEPSQTNQQINSIIPRRPEYSFYLYFQMLEKQQVFLDLASGGSATLNMNTSTFSKVETLLPDDGVITKFNELVMPVFSQILANQKQADNLAQLRDILLPKLLSGELRIPDAEAVL